MNQAEIKILIVEDEELLRDILALVLRDEGYNVDIATNGAEAWELISQNHYDLLATDLFMPIMNGFDLILKTQATYPSIKIMLISGGGKEVDAESGQKIIQYQNRTAEVDIFLKKPYSIDLLLSYIEKVLAT